MGKMKKRFTTLLIVFITALVALSAGFDYRFDLLSFEPLHQEYTADRDRAGLDFQWMWSDSMPEGVWQNGLYYPFLEVGGKDHQATDGFDESPWMGFMHLGETLGLARSTFTFDHWLSPVSFDFSFQGSMVLGMEGGMADMIGYDGVFFYGASASIADRFSMRIGLHHYCTHYGDGTLKLLGLDRNGIAFDPAGDANSNFTIYKKYIRMEALAVGFSIVPYDGIRLYTEMNFALPGLTDAFDTMIFAPTWFDPKNNIHVQNKDDSYNAMIVNFGIELSYPIFPKLGKTTLSYDCHAYEEGKIKYKPADLAKYPDYDPSYRAYYDKDAAWEFEHELVLSQEINDIVSFEIGWHNGRFPLNSMYYQRCNYVYVGARVNPDATVTLYDSAKR